MSDIKQQWTIWTTDVYPSGNGSEPLGVTENVKVIKAVDKINRENSWKIFKITIDDVDPQPYARPRKSRKLEAAGKANPFYNPRSGYKKKLGKAIKALIENKLDGELVTGEVHLTAKFYLTPTKKYVESKVMWELLKFGIIRPAVRPDVDNWIKPVMDVLNDLFYKDDGQITTLTTEKYYSTTGKQYIELFFEYRKDPIKLR